MEKIFISKTLLPNLNNAGKQLINDGIWFLYKIKAIKNFNYMLINSSDIQLIDSTGNSIEYSNEQFGSLEISNRIYFN